MITLRDYQSEWIGGLRAAFQAGFHSPLGVLPTGGGKTVCFSYLTSKLVAAKKRVIIMAHREELLDQISDTLSRFEVNHGRISAGCAYDARLLAHVASAMTLIRRLDKIEIPDYLVCDEAHHATANSTWGKIIAYVRMRNPRVRIIGVSATPERLSGEGLGETFDEMVLGPTTAELIEIGALAPYRLISPVGHSTDFDSVSKSGGDYNKKGVAQVFREKPSIVGDAVAHYRKVCDGVPAVAFCVSIEETKNVAQRFRDAGYSAASIDGEMEREERRRIVREYSAGRIQILTAAEIVSEGFDVPGIVAAILLRPTYSLALYLQQVGRALRPAPGKESAIILDHVGNCGRIEGGQFVSKHGLPDDPREWSLIGRDKRRGKKPEASCRQCTTYKLETTIVVKGRAYAPGAMVGGCFAVSPAAAWRCKECEVPFPVNSRVIEEVAGELSEIEVAQLKIAAKRQQASAETLEDLLRVARETGKKPGWAHHVWAARQKKRAAQAERRGAHG